MLYSHGQTDDQDIGPTPRLAATNSVESLADMAGRLTARAFQVWAIMADLADHDGVYRHGTNAIAKRLELIRTHVSTILNDRKSGLIAAGIVQVETRSGFGNTYRVAPMPCARHQRSAILAAHSGGYVKQVQPAPSDNSHAGSHLVAPGSDRAIESTEAGQSTDVGKTPQRAQNPTSDISDTARYFPQRAQIPTSEKSNAVGKIERPPSEKSNAVGKIERRTPEKSNAPRTRGGIGITVIPNSSSPIPKNTQTTTTLVQLTTEPEPSSSSSRVCSLPKQDTDSLAAAFTDESGPLSLQWILAEFTDQTIADALAFVRVNRPSDITAAAKLRAAFSSGWTFANNPSASLLEQNGIANREALCRKFSEQHIKANVDFKKMQFVNQKRRPELLPAAIANGIICNDAKFTIEAEQKRAATAAAMIGTQAAEARRKSDEARAAIEAAAIDKRERADNLARFNAVAPSVLESAVAEYLDGLTHIVQGNAERKSRKAFATAAEFAAVPRRAKPITDIVNRILSGEPRRVPLQESP